MNMHVSLCLRLFVFRIFSFHFANLFAFFMLIVHWAFIGFLCVISLLLLELLPCQKFGQFVTLIEFPCRAKRAK